ncbi:hypothetical protein P3W45_000057 [Vairimorpha bombi]|jgi:predicted RNase H-like nuclease (RuvC/YqgF family)
MNDFYTKKLEDLLTENRNLYKQNIKLKEDLNTSANKICTMKTQVCTLNNQVSHLDQEMRKLEMECKTKDNKLRKSELFMKNEFKRKDILNNKLIGSNKSVKEIELKNEINKLYLRNNILSKFIKEIFDKTDMDFKMFYDMLEVVDNSDDETLKFFIQEIKEKSSSL